VDHPGFIEGCAAQISQAVPDLSADDALILTAHAIPEPVEVTSQYRQQFIETSQLIADKLGQSEHHIAFQSAPDGPGVKWSTPDVLDVMKDLAAKGAKRFVLQAAGFLVDHTEVTFDLDVEAKELAAELGVEFVRAPCVHSHPSFIAALADRVEAVLENQPA